MEWNLTQNPGTPSLHISIPNSVFQAIHIWFWDSYFASTGQYRLNDQATQQLKAHSLGSVVSYVFHKFYFGLLITLLVIITEKFISVNYLLLLVVSYYWKK